VRGKLRRLPRRCRKGGAAIALADPVYLAIADDTVMRKVIANGARRTAMLPLRKAPEEC